MWRKEAMMSLYRNLENTLYYLNGKDGLYTKTFLINFCKFFLTFKKFTKDFECWLTVEETKITTEDCEDLYDPHR